LWVMLVLRLAFRKATKLLQLGSRQASKFGAEPAETPPFALGRARGGNCGARLALLQRALSGGPSAGMGKLDCPYIGTTQWKPSRYDDSLAANAQTRPCCAAYCSDCGAAPRRRGTTMNLKSLPFARQGSVQNQEKGNVNVPSSDRIGRARGRIKQFRFCSRPIWPD
jgi:hypothetical protein